MKKSLNILFLSMFLLTGCASATFAPVDVKANYAKRTDAQDIKIFRSEIPKEEFVEVGTLNGNGNSEKIIEKFRQEASGRGGDAIISLESYPNGMSATVIRMKK